MLKPKPLLAYSTSVLVDKDFASEGSACWNPLSFGHPKTPHTAGKGRWPAQENVWHMEETPTRTPMNLETNSLPMGDGPLACCVPGTQKHRHRKQKHAQTHMTKTNLHWDVSKATSLLNGAGLVHSQARRFGNEPHRHTILELALWISPWGNNTPTKRPRLNLNVNCIGLSPTVRGHKSESYRVPTSQNAKLY